MKKAIGVLGTAVLALKMISFHCDDLSPPKAVDCASAWTRSPPNSLTAWWQVESSTECSGMKRYPVPYNASSCAADVTANLSPTYRDNKQATTTMVKALRFKGDPKKPKKRKRAAAETEENDNGGEGSSSRSTVTKRPKEKEEEDEEPEGWVDSEVLGNYIHTSLSLPPVPGSWKLTNTILLPEDLTGPILITIASTPPTCLASDAIGSVFASPLTAIEGENLSTAEPTAVQQVWVCARVYGSTTGKFTLRSHTGKYLSCSKTGELSATRDAIGPEEEFVPVRSELGGPRWAWQTCRDKFIGVDEKAGGGGAGGVVVRGDRDDVGFRETWTVRLQKRNKVRVKAGGGVEEKGRTKDRVSRKELEDMAGFALDDDQVKLLRKARKEGGFHEALLDLKVKHGKHDKFAY
jgi:protein FRG1